MLIRSITYLVLTLLISACSVQPRLDGSAWNASSDAIDSYYRDWQGTPYRLGGTGRGGLDCSAFVQNLYAEVFNQGLARTTELQAEQGAQILPGDLEPGDLIFFKTGWKARHVGVYVGDNQFVHASTSVGVTRSSLKNEYWRDTFWQARRVNASP